MFATTVAATSNAAGDERPGRLRREDGGVVVEARELTRSFDDITVVKSLDLSIERGSIIGLIGPSGCGKTTTVRLLTGLLRPSSGEALLGGTPAAELSAARRRDLGYLPQIPALFPELSLWENLSFHASMYGLPLRRRSLLRSMLEWVELDEHRHKKVAEASGGMQRRLALAAALVHDPEIVFLDEPTAGIDPILREKFWEHFRGLAEAGKTLLVTTQYVGEAAYCDYVGLLSDGELLLFDTPANLRRAAFDGEVLDVNLRRRRPTPRSPSSNSCRSWSAASSARVRPVFVSSSTVRCSRRCRQRLVEVGLDVESVDEHVVDYDEAFVRVVERHRSAQQLAETQGEAVAREGSDAC